MDTKDVFISYSSLDRGFATELYNALQRAGVKVWMDVVDIPPGKHWDRMIQHAVETCSHLVLVHTLPSFESNNVWDEWSFFVSRNKPVIPLIVDNVPLPFRLERLHHVDFVTQTFRCAVKQLVQVLPGPTPMPGIALRTTMNIQPQDIDLRQIDLKQYSENRAGRTRRIEAPYDDRIPGSELPLRYERDLQFDDLGDTDSKKLYYPASRSDYAAPPNEAEEFIDEAEEYVDSRFRHILQPLVDLTRQTIGTNKTVRKQPPRDGAEA